MSTGSAYPASRSNAAIAIPSRSNAGLRHHLLRFEEVGRDALVVQARHDLAHRRLVLGRMEHQQAGLAEPRVPRGVPLEVAEHRDRSRAPRPGTFV